MSVHGHKLNFDENNIAVCPETGWKYKLADGEVILLNNER
jgi:nitrite reductase/ring-hydroxylating ferredoxin subunit